MDTGKLEVFLETVRYGSINKAAEKLGYTSSGLTYLLNTFETEIGIPLLHRTRSGVSLTPEAVQLVPSMERLLKAESEFHLKVRSTQQKGNDRISLGCYSSVAISWLPSVIQNFSHKYPDVIVDLRIGNTEISDLLENDEIDFGIVDINMKGDYDWQFLADDNMCAYIPDHYYFCDRESVTLEELKAYPLIFPSYESSDFVSSFMDHCSIRELSRLRISTLSGSDILQFVSQDLGIAILSHFCAIEAPANVKVRPIEPRISRQLGIISKKNRHLTELQSCLLALIKKTAEHST